MIAGQTPLFKWACSDAAKKPALFAAHYDVVPTLEDSLDRWNSHYFQAPSPTALFGDAARWTTRAR